MKKVIKKTEKEIEKEKFKEMRVSDVSSNYYYHCERCNMAFFKDDYILGHSSGYNVLSKKYDCCVIRCPICQSDDMLGGDEKDFEKYYKLEDEANKKLAYDKPIPSHKPIHFDNS